MDDWIEAGAAAERLGVKPATLYAYVSRGVLRRRRDPGTRRSLFDPAEIEQLARRGKPRRRPAPAEIAIESRVTVLGEDRPYYRGHDALDLAVTGTYEAVAEWLWTGEWLDTEPWQARTEGVAAARAAQAGLAGDLLPLDRLQIAVTALAVTDPLRFHRDPPAVVATGRTLIAGMVEALPALSDPIAGSIAGVLWSRLCPRPPRDRALLAALEAALILLADHELAASTFAARVAASVQADPYAVVSTGLGVLGGPMHGGASLGVERMLAEISDPAQAPRVIGERLRRGERLPGAGHTVYRSGDARGGRLLSLIREAVPGHERLAVTEAILAELRGRRLPEPNVDFMLGLLVAITGMVPGSGQAIFAVARTAGWLAHALEEYDRRAPLRPRAIAPRDAQVSSR